jgi:putative membrane protein insertion efficiency factor
MKKIIISIIGFYQMILSNLILQLTGTSNACRFSPTCSEYAKLSISEQGLFKGSYLSIVRLLKCQPFYNGN